MVRLISPLAASTFIWLRGDHGACLEKNAVLQVYEHLRGTGLVEAVALQCYPLRGRQFNVHSV